MTSMTLWQDYRIKQATAGVGLAGRVAGAAGKALGFLRNVRPPAVVPPAPVGRVGVQQAATRMNAGGAALPKPPVAAPPAGGGNYWNYQGVGAIPKAPAWRRFGDKITAPVRWLASKPALPILAYTGTGAMAGFNEYKKNEMMNHGIQDYASGVSTGGAGMWRGFSELPWHQRLMAAMNPGAALNSRSMYDQLHSRISGMGGQAKELAPGIIEQFFAKAQPGAPLTGPTVPASDLTFETLRQQQEQLRQMLQKVQPAVAANP